MTKCSRCDEPMASDDMVEVVTPDRKILVVHLECQEPGDSY